MLLLSLPLATVVAASWVLAVALIHPFDSSPYPAWMLWNYRQIGLPSIASISYFFKYGIWFAWPAWPFAAWAIYAWRKQERALHISLPVSFLLCFVTLAFINNDLEEANLLPILPPLAILASFGLPTMKRSAINAVDWFAVMILTGVASIVWLYWIAAQTGWPSTMAKKVAIWAPGFQSEFNAFTFIVALLASIAWFRLVYWRISRQPSVLWRAVVLSGGGAILCWVLPMTLFLSLINQRISYATVSSQMAQQLITPYRCIESNVGPSQRASFAYFGKLKFAGFSDQNCDVLLLQSSRHSPSELRDQPDKNFPGAWQLEWQGHRNADKDELFSLYRRK
jgi:hypothetical protein